MAEPVTVRDAMNRDYVGVSESDPVSGAADLMHREGVNGAVVLRGQEAVGMLGAGDVVAVVAAGADPEEVETGEAMSTAILALDGGMRLSEAVGLLATSGARRGVVEENGTVVGILSDHDVISAHAALPSNDPDSLASVGEEPPVADDSQATPVDEAFPTQGVCEGCGAFARSLEPDNGRLVCPDCLET